jgi:hypothetical protein
VRPIRLDYHDPRPPRVSRRQLWIGINLWLIVAAFMAAAVFQLLKDDPTL